MSNRHGRRASGKEPEKGVMGSGREPPKSMIAVAAYYRAESRGFAPGRELEDWLAAEAEIERLLRRPRTGI